VARFIYNFSVIYAEQKQEPGTNAKFYRDKNEWSSCATNGGKIHESWAEQTRRKTKELVLRQVVVKSTKDVQDIIEEIIENKVNHTFSMDNVDYSELQDYTSTDCSAVEKESQS